MLVVCRPRCSVAGTERRVCTCSPANAGAHIHKAAVGRQAALRDQAVQHALHAAARQRAVQPLDALPAAQLVLHACITRRWLPLL